MKHNGEQSSRANAGQALEIFTEALQRRDEDREAYLRDRCGGDAALRAEVDRLLNLDAAAHRSHFLASQTQLTAKDVLADPLLTKPFGRYQLVRLLGEGAMGRVYMARQDTPERFVAVKVLRPYMLSPEVRKRFDREAQYLAQLQHETIAQIYESGVADTVAGRMPYIAMELIEDAIPITDYVMVSGLSVPERLALFVSVCEGVQYAHEKSIVHRDLKPGNVLINGRGRPKIVDFGVARAIAAAAPGTFQTETGRIIGTLPYMSPEQCAGDAKPVDARTDVYALGVILYELLTNRLPYDVQFVGIVEAARVIREQQPERLSRWNTRLATDVETVVLKALEKEPERRYSTADALASDLKRILRKEPITARPPSAIYLARKFAQRHRGVVVGVAATILALVAGLVGTTTALLRAHEAEREARVAASRAQGTSEFLVDIFNVSSPLEAGQGDLTVRELLINSYNRLVAQPAPEDPLVELARMEALGAVLDTLYLFEKSHHLYKMAVQRKRDVFGVQHIEVATTLVHLGWAEFNLGLVDDAVGSLLEAIDIVKDQDASRADILSSALNNLAVLIANTADYARAKDLHREVIDIVSRTSGPEHPDMATVLHNYATTLMSHGSFAQAEDAFHRALAIRLNAHADDETATSPIYHGLGVTLKFMHRFDEARTFLKRAAEIRNRIFGESHPIYANSLTHLGDTLRALGEYDQARLLLQQARSILGSAGESNLRRVAYVAEYQGDLEYELGLYDSAEKYYRESYEIRGTLYPPDHPFVATSQHKLGLALLRLNRPADAEPFIRIALETRKNKLPGSPLIETTQYALDECLSTLEVEKAD